YEGYYDGLFAELCDYFSKKGMAMPLRTGFRIYTASNHNASQEVWEKWVVGTFLCLCRYHSPDVQGLVRASTPIDGRCVENVSFKESDDSNGDDSYSTGRSDLAEEVKSTTESETSTAVLEAESDESTVEPEEVKRVRYPYESQMM